MGVGYFLSVLFPSWAFFIEPGPSIRLEYFAEGAWHRAIEPIQRHWSRLLFNPEAGFLHAANNAVDHLLIAVADLPESAPQSEAERTAIENLSEYKIVKNLAKLAASENGPTQSACRRFRILAADEVVFQSPEFE